MKHCPRCEETKSLEEFAKNRRKPDGYQFVCRSCKKEVQHAWYMANRVEHMRNVRRNARASIREARRRLMGYLQSHPCVDCREDDPLILEFDHVKDRKEFNICDMLRRFCWNRIKREIEKCDVRCCNCHTRITRQRQKDWRWQALRSLNGKVPDS